MASGRPPALVGRDGKGVIGPSDSAGLHRTALKYTAPTERNYGELNHAYDYFNEKLFDGELLRCLITMQRRRQAYGYYCSARFASYDGKEIVDEIALNPVHLATRTAKQVLSTLVHEQCHLWQHHFGKPSRSGYHNRQWAQKMRSVGLIPSDTGEPGGREVGRRVSHYIAEGQAFDRACDDLLSFGFVIPYVDVRSSNSLPSANRIRAAKLASKSVYVCPHCGVRLWGKPRLHVVCGLCDVQLVGS